MPEALGLPAATHVCARRPGVLGFFEYYLVEQEGYDLPEFETVKLCLENFKKVHG